MKTYQDHLDLMRSIYDPTDPMMRAIGDLIFHAEKLTPEQLQSDIDWKRIELT